MVQSLTIFAVIKIKPLRLIPLENYVYQIDEKLGSIKFDMEKIFQKLREVDSISLHDTYKNIGINVVIEPIISNENNKLFQECTIKIMVLGKDSISCTAEHNSKVSLTSPEDQSGNTFEFTEMNKLIEFAENTENELKKRIDETQNTI